jgi:hypothetical protein
VYGITQSQERQEPSGQANPKSAILNPASS